MNRTDEPDIKQMILYEDRDILVCHKAAGLPVQSAGVGTKDLESILKNYLKERKQAEQEDKTGKGSSVRADAQKVLYLGIIHRLDQPVEGILVFAKNKKAAAGLSRQISGGTFRKVYLAVCCVDNVSESGDKRTESGKAGETADMDEKSGEISLTDWMKKDGRVNTSVLVSPDMPGAKKAELRYRVLKRRTIQEKEYALARVILLTGRHHQIRVQMANAGLPLYGDRKYNAGWKEFCVPEYDAAAGKGLLLCAAELTFAHPGTGKEMCFSVSQDFMKKFENF